ncbi:AAA family ATPase [Pseudomonas bijieensis]|uniref:AAA family ATPase n=1 Tax=Pseudomonas bijieensis TaxID=2681983 RepID=UPI00200EAA7D|nr:AAA family ATPase [Pseudomonas bijieensis]UQI28494.1 AAA family ATPase [Pseudomonas bijieensis]
MQRFDRSSEPPPALLRSAEFNAQRQAMVDYFLMDERRRAQTRAPDLSLELNHQSVNDALRRLFHAKCAFCERSTKTFPYRFRPATDALPMVHKSQAHLYYVWLSNAWENLYPICQECFPQRPEYFPVAGRRAALPTSTQLETYAAERIGLWREHPPKEKNLLLDPCEGSFIPHLTVDLYGYLFPHTDRARETVNHFNLNRGDLYTARGERMREYFDELIEGVFPLMRQAQYARYEGRLFDFGELEFGGAWYLMCRQIVLFLTAGNPRHWSLSLSRIEQTFHKLARSVSAGIDRDKLEEWLNDSLRDMFTEDSHVTRFSLDTPPTLSGVSLINFKGIEQLELVMPAAKTAPADLADPLQPALLILGENAAGKSSILEAIALALATDEARAELKLDVSALPLDPQLLGERSAPRREKATVRLRFDDGSTRLLNIAGGRFSMAGGTELPPVFAYGAFRQYQKRTRRYSHGKSILNLFHSDKLLSNPEKWLLGLDQDDFDTVVRALRVILSIEGEFEVMERDYENKRCLIVTAAQGNHASNRTPLSLASSGYRSMLAMVCDIIQGLMGVNIHTFVESLETARAVVLIDEIEAHLHPRWKIQIMKALRSALPKVTFIVTTHDPLCLRGMEDGEVIVMQRVASQNGADSEWPVMVEQVVRLPDVSRLTIEQLLTSDFFGLASTDQPGTERELAMFADLLAARENGQPLTVDQQLAWVRFEQDISDALPVGNTEVQRLVQEAVSEYLKNRRQLSTENLGRLRDQSRRDIVAILEAL